MRGSTRPTKLGKTVVAVEDIGAAHLYREIVTSGEIVAVLSPKIRLVEGVFECQRCHERQTRLQPSPDRYDVPDHCPCCGGEEYELLPDLSRWCDYQEFQLREHGAENDRPRCLFPCRAEGDLVGRFHEGAFVSVKAIPQPSEQMFSTFELMLEIIGIEDGGDASRSKHANKRKE